MKVQVISNASDAHHAQFIGKVAIVIDVIRTSTTIITALQAGAKCVIPVETIMEAKAMKRGDERLGGERFCKPISGFDLGNSPQQYRTEELKDTTIILTTTNGTNAIHRCTRAVELYIAGLVNASACINTATQSGKDIVILCAGSHDQFVIEDGYCAGYMIARLQEQLPSQQLELDDFAQAMLALYKHSEHNISELVRGCLSGKRLQEIGLNEDVAECLEVDTIPVVPRFHNNRLVAVNPAAALADQSAEHSADRNEAPRQ